MKVKLGDVATYINGYAFKPSDWSDHGKPIIRIQDLTGNSYQMNRFDGICDDKYNVRAGDVLISWSASLGVYVWQGEDAVLNQHIFKVVFNKKKLNKRFFVYQVGNILEKASSEAHGATMKHLTKPVFDALPFYLPEIKKQNEIAYKLDAVCDIIDKRDRQIQKLDELVKARFVEMFGDPIANEKGWKTKPLLSMGACKNGMNFHYDDSGVELNCLGVGDFKDYSIISDTAALPMVSLNEMPSSEYLLQDDDIVFVRSNGNKKMVGRSIAVYPGNIPTTFSGFCIRYRRMDDSVITPYLLRVLKAESMRQKMYGRGANIQNLNQQTLSSLDIPVPPKEMQEQFAVFVSQVDKSKLSIQASLDQLETLKQSLMQKYFG